MPTRQAPAAVRQPGQPLAPALAVLMTAVGTWLQGCVASTTPGGASRPIATQLFSGPDVLYSTYREGVIERHIAQNGAYLEDMLLRDADAVDLGQEGFPQSLFPKSGLLENARVGRMGLPLLPVAYREDLSPARRAPPGFMPLGALGYVSERPGEGLAPLYEWIANSSREPEAWRSREDYYYDTNPDAPTRRMRYRQTGIVGFIVTDPSAWSLDAALTPLFSGFDPSSYTHLLTTDKRLGTQLGMKRWRQLGYVFDSGMSAHGIPLQGMASFREYIKTPESGHAVHWYSTVRPPATPLGPDRHVFLRDVASGGGDNPLYEAGLALATFSLEHIHGVSDHALAYAIHLFEFIESSEEIAPDVLGTVDSSFSTGQTGFLRRSKSFWAPASTWGASTDELVGVLLGLRYFITATEPSNAAYNQRARMLLQRIAIYLSSRHWVYLDTREYPSSERLAQLASGSQEDQDVLGRALGTLAFQRPISQVFADVLGDSYRHEFSESYDILSGLVSQTVDPWGNFLLLGDHIGVQASDVLGSVLKADLTWYGIAALGCPAQWIADLTNHYDLFDYACLAPVNNHDAFYRLLVKNSGAYEYYAGPKTFYNYTMIAYLGLLFLSSPSWDTGPQEWEAVKPFAQAHVAFVNALWGQLARPESPGSSVWHYSGDGSNNVLLALLAKLAMSHLTDKEIEDSFVGSDWSAHDRKNVRFRFKEEVDYVLRRYLLGFDVDSNPWQKALAVAAPSDMSSCSCATGPCTPVPGIGRNSAWRHGSQEFTMPRRAVQEWLADVGPWYKGAECAGWEYAAPCEALAKTVKDLSDLAELAHRSYEAERRRLQADGFTPADQQALAPLMTAELDAWDRVYAADRELAICEAGNPSTCRARFEDDDDIGRTREEVARRGRVGAFLPFTRNVVFSPDGTAGVATCLLAESGGNDYMLMRMLATEYGLAAAPRLLRDDLLPILPLRGPEPWLDYPPAGE